VAVDDVAGRAVHHDLRHPADDVERADEGRPLLLGMRPPVGGVREELVRRFLAVTDDAVAPRRSFGRRRPGHQVRPCIVAPAE
jgi:hypothetical protein